MKKIKQAVILAAGKSTRTYPLTLNKPKALLKILGKTILEHNLDQLEGLVKEVLIVVGYKSGMIKTRIDSSYKGIKIKYIEQKEQTGTGSALLICKDFLKKRFLVLNGDDFFSRKDIERCIQNKHCVLASEVKDPQSFGIFELNGSKVIGLEEKPKNPKSNLANTGLYVFDREIFNYKLEKTERGEYEITDYLKYLIKNKEVILEKVKDYWKPIVYSWSLFPILEILLKKSKIEGKVEKTKIKGTVYIGKNSILKSCKLSGFINIGDNCVVENSEIKDCIIGDNNKIENSTLLDSVIGDSVELENCKTKNKPDKGKIDVNLNGKIVECKRDRLGALIGDKVKAEKITFSAGQTVSEDL